MPVTCTAQVEANCEPKSAFSRCCLCANEAKRVRLAAAVKTRFVRPMAWPPAVPPTSLLSTVTSESTSMSTGCTGGTSTNIFLFMYSATRKSHAFKLLSESTKVLALIMQNVPFVFE